ncbi:MAG: hypothetical protein NTX45_23455 [Proteobacteria bacterium]|nr:hypothetical protein [Pseudomonadota bacterium]
MKKWTIRIVISLLVVVFLLALVFVFFVWDAFKHMDEKLADDKRAVEAGLELGRKAAPQECVVEELKRYEKCMEKWTAIECRWIEPNFVSTCLDASGITEEFCRPIPRLSKDGSLQGQESDYEEALAWTQNLCEFERPSVKFDMCRRIFFVARYHCDVKYPQR